MKIQTLKDYYKNIDSFDNLKEGDVVLISEGFSLFKHKKSNELKKGIVVKKVSKKGLFKRNECIIYNVNILNYPDEELVIKIMKYYKNHEDEILKGDFEFINKFSKGEPIYLVKGGNKKIKS